MKALPTTTAYSYWLDRMAEILSSYEDVEELPSAQDKPDPKKPEQKDPSKRPRIEKGERVKLFKATCENLIAVAQKTKLPSLAVFGDVVKILRYCTEAIEDSMTDGRFVEEDGFQTLEEVILDKYGQPIVDEHGKERTRQVVLFTLADKEKVGQAIKNRIRWVKKYAYEYEGIGYESENDEDEKGNQRKKRDK